MSRFKLLAGVAVAAALALSGCGSNQTAGSGSAANQQQDSGSTVFQSLADLAAKAGPASAAKSSAHVSITTEGGSQSLHGQGDLRLGNDPAINLTINAGAAGDIGIRLVDSVFYVNLGAASPSADKPWIKIDASGSDPMSKTFASLVNALKTQSDPAQAFKQMAGAGQITAVKPEQLNGQPTTHYSIDVDLQKLVALQEDPNLKQLMQTAVAAIGQKTVPYEVWLNKDNLPVKLTSSVPVQDPTTKQATVTKTTIEYSDWGKQVNITAPPANQISGG
jgi:hypothetical protein